MPTVRVTRPQAADTSSLPLIAPPNVSESFGERARHLFDERAAAAALRVNNPIDVATEPAPREQPPRTDTSTDAVLYHRLKTTLEVIFVSDWGEFITQYQFNELDDRMSKLEKGQTITKTAEETTVELDGEMSMHTELIRKLITQQVAVANAKKSKEYGKKIKKLEKGGKDRVSGKTSRKNSTRGGGRASQKHKSSKTHTTTKSDPPQKSASQSAQGRKSILQSPSQGRSQQAGAADSGTREKVKRTKAARSKSASRSTLQTSKTDGAKSRGRSKKRWTPELRPPELR